MPRTTYSVKLEPGNCDALQGGRVESITNADAAQADASAPRSEQRLSSLEQRVTIAIFVATLVLLGTLTWALKPPRKMMMENRYATSLPALEANWESVKTFPPRMESYFTDRFALREKIISARNILSFVGLHCSGTPDVLIGPDGWLDYRGDGNLTSFLNRDLFTEEEVARVGSEIEARRQWLARRGIQFLFMIAPDKSSLYPSMPAYFTHKPGPTREDQLLHYLRTHTKVETVDLRAAIKTAMRKHPKTLLYWKTDSHWNELGAYTAYCSIFDKLKQWFPQMRTPSARCREQYEFSGDLSKIGGLMPWVHEQGPKLVAGSGIKAWHERSDYKTVHNTMPEAAEPRRTTLTEVDDASLPRAVILHDSFMLALQPFLSYNFKRSLNLWCYGFPLETILAEKPDIVIEEEVERQLVNCTPKPTPQFIQCDGSI